MMYKRKSNIILTCYKIGIHVFIIYLKKITYNKSQTLEFAIDLNLGSLVKYTKTPS